MNHHGSELWQNKYKSTWVEMLGEGVGEFTRDQIVSKHPTIFRPCLRDSSGKFGNYLLHIDLNIGSMRV